MKRWLGWLLVVGWLLTSRMVFGQQPFADLVGPVAVQPVADGAPLQVPYITWGGDVATFLANGGLETQANSTYAQMGLRLKLTAGDDFVEQVRQYVSGKTPFLRGTMTMLGQASEVLSRDPRTKPVVILQLSWSAGDHIVARANLKTLNDLRGQGRKIKIACQQGGPHVGLLYDSLDAAKIGRDEIEVVWVNDLTGPKGPAARFRQDASIDACCVISPDMAGLTGGYGQTGTGKEDTVEGAHVLNSTRDMSRSIADVYAVRSDWLAKHEDVARKFVAGYLKGTQTIVTLRKEFDQSQKMSDEYRRVLKMAQSIFGEEVLPTLEIDGHDLLRDCGFVGLPGQIAFFQDRGNLSGFDAKMKSALDLATTWGYAKFRSGFEPPRWDYQQIAKLAGLEYVQPQAQAAIEIGDGGLFPDTDGLDDRTIVSFTIKFQPNQPDFSADRYGAEFNRAVQAASTFGNAVIVIRGHADPTKTLLDVIKAGMQKGIVKRSGQQGNYQYFVQGKPFDLTQTATVLKLVESGVFETADIRPKETVRAAQNLSLSRAEAVKQSLVQFAKQQGVNLDASQLQPTGAGIAEPLIPKPADFQQALENMRVEFRIVRVPAEALHESDFAF